MKHRHEEDAREISWDWSVCSNNRISVVNALIHLTGGYESDYLEIGCFQDELFNAVFAKNKVGVDPEQGGTIRTTSDRFFEDNDLQFDVVFIDGLHEYEQVRKDTVNALKCLKPNGFIAYHDMLPGSWKQQHVPRLQQEWTGDVWKLGFELAASPELDFQIVTVDYGVGVLRKKSPDAEMVDLQNSMLQRSFGYFYDNYEQLPMLSWESFVQLSSS